MLYTLYNKNIPILDFRYDLESETITDIVQKHSEALAYAPLGIKNSKNEITKKLLGDWWKQRSIPASRDGLKELKDELNANFEILKRKAFGAGLSDQYWIKPEGTNITWDDINFFNNPFSDDIGKALIEGKISDTLLDSRSPDATSDGNLKKRWKIIDGTRYLIKGGSSILNQEPFNEVIATCLYRRLLKDGEYVIYDLIEDNNEIYSKCANFINTDTELVSAIYIDATLKSRESDILYERYLNCCEMLGIPNVKEHLDKMLVCDYILANHDRHYRNFGAIRNINTLEWVGPAPIFDSGSSLWSNSSDNAIGSEFKPKPFVRDTEQLLKLFNDLDWLDFSKLDGFTDEMKEILSQNDKLSKSRINKIIKATSLRIKKLKSLKDKK